MLTALRPEYCRMAFNSYIFFTLCTSIVFANKYSANEYSVYKAITTDYDKNVRPVHNSSKATVISIQLTYFTLLSMDQKQETLTFVNEVEMNFCVTVHMQHHKEDFLPMIVCRRVRCGSLQIWIDEILSWNSSEFGDISSVLIPASLLWMPDITVTTGLNVDYLIPDGQRFVKVLSDGTVISSSPCVITNQCKLNIEQFPFDIQACNVTLGSWKYPANQIELVVGHKPRNITVIDDRDKYQGSGEWFLLSIEPTVHYFNDDGELYAQVYYEIGIKRQPIYYICVLLIPTFLTATICLVGLFVPAINTGERSEKVNMGLTALLAMAVILGTVADQMPKTTTLPLLGFYILAELIICTIGVGISMLMMVAHQRVSTRAVTPPRWINTFVLLKMKSLAKPEKTDVMTVNTENTIQPMSNNQQMNDLMERTINSMYVKQLKQALNDVKQYIDDGKFKDYLNLQWIIIFDRIDTFFLILFNVVNVLMSIILLF